MHRYQTMMGQIQDFEVLLRAFGKFARKGWVDPEPAAQFRQALEQRRDRLVEGFLARSARLEGFWPNGHGEDRRGTRRPPA